ncbi:hypothetical protein CVT26_010431 [Gymnopilus dilepis]|uniref:Uncharacterized protein n=1 Tax=Gymnopilus dilepis TaxID=231916 RepID=A0A409Y0J9_9AGAR|nr:hypothetical protein CVT26_010431 [Gymnopilus dilepis]
MSPKKPRKATSPRDPAGAPDLSINAVNLDRHARYRLRNRDEINRKKREKMREKRASERLQKSVRVPVEATSSGSHELLPGLPWLQSPEDIACAEVLASLRSRASMQQTQDGFADTARRNIEETSEVTASYAELDGWKYLNGLRGLVQKWGSVWGGVVYWPDALEEMFLEACEEGRSGAMNLAYRVWDHADEGRALLREVEKMDGRLPDLPRALKFLWVEYSKLHHLLIRGITIIEAQMNAIDPGVFRLPGAPMSSDEDDGSEGDWE